MDDIPARYWVPAFAVAILAVVLVVSHRYNDGRPPAPPSGTFTLQSDYDTDDLVALLSDRNNPPPKNATIEQIPPPHTQSGLTTAQRWVWMIDPCIVVQWKVNGGPASEGEGAENAGCWIKIDFADPLHVQVLENFEAGTVAWKAVATLETKANKVEDWHVAKITEGSKAVMTAKPE